MQACSAAQRVTANLVLGTLPQLCQALLIWDIGQVAILRPQHDRHLHKQTSQTLWPHLAANITLAASHSVLDKADRLGSMQAAQHT